MKKNKSGRPWTDGLSTAVRNALLNANFESRAEVAEVMKSGSLTMKDENARFGFHGSMLNRFDFDLRRPVPGVGKKGLEEIKTWLAANDGQPDDEWLRGLSKKAAAAVVEAGFHSKKMVQEDLQSLEDPFWWVRLEGMWGVGRKTVGEIRAWAGFPRNRADVEPSKDKIFMNALNPKLRKKMMKHGFYGKKDMLQGFLKAHYAELKYTYHGVDLYLNFLQPAEIKQLRELTDIPEPSEIQIDAAKIEAARTFLEERGFAVRKTREKEKAPK